MGNLSHFGRDVVIFIRFIWVFIRIVLFLSV